MNNQLHYYQDIRYLHHFLYPTPAQWTNEGCSSRGLRINFNHPSFFNPSQNLFRDTPKGGFYFSTPLPLKCSCGSRELKLQLRDQQQNTTATELQQHMHVPEGCNALKRSTWRIHIVLRAGDHYNIHMWSSHVTGEPQWH